MVDDRLEGIFPRRPFPQVCVWEITLTCNASCMHCGSRAGAARQDELGLAQALDVVRDLADLGCECVTLSGGEPLLREDWPHLASAIRARGMRVELITNGWLAFAQREAIAQAGFSSVSFSIDGPAEVHNRLRGMPDGLERLLQGAGALAERGVRLGAVTQINRANLPHLEATHALLCAHGFRGWQVQLTLPYGRAADSPDLCTRPEDLPRIERTLLGILENTPLFVQTADTIGYMTRAEPRLRTGSRRANCIWSGCQAGLRTIGITSDGTVRGCLSLPPAFDEGNLTRRPLRDIWQDAAAFAYRRQFAHERLTGACRDCAYWRLCGGGCPALAFATLGRVGENVYCLHRQAQRG